MVFLREAFQARLDAYPTPPEQDRLIETLNHDNATQTEAGAEGNEEAR